MKNALENDVFVGNIFKFNNKFKEQENLNKIFKKLIKKYNNTKRNEIAHYPNSFKSILSKFNLYEEPRVKRGSDIVNKREQNYFVPFENAYMGIDHIKPNSFFPNQSLDLTNLKVSTDIYLKNNFINDITYYFEKNYDTNEEINQIFKEELNKFLENQEVVDISNFFDEFNQHLNSEEVNEYYSSWQPEFKEFSDENLEFFNELVSKVILTFEELVEDKKKLKYFLIKESKKRYCKNLFNILFHLQLAISKAIPLKFITEEYFDLIFTYKLEVISITNTKVKFINHFNFKVNQYARERYKRPFNRIIVFLN
jgi:hypothetical protein